jgi:hypothetical protein
MFCREKMADFLKENCAMVGGQNKTVEIDESKFCKRKYNRGHRVTGQWVFGGVERESGATFLVPVERRDAATLTALIHKWIHPGTTIISDCWAAYRDIGSLRYEHRTVNHSISFVDPNTGAHTNTIEGIWSQVKAFVRPYNRKKDYEFHLAHYMFAKQCKVQGVPTFTKFIHVVANTDWSTCLQPC